MDAYIYILKCIDGHYYVGSCLNEPSERLLVHKAHSLKFPNRKLYKHILSVGWHNVTMEVIDAHVENKMELRFIEDQIIDCALDDELCLNSFRAVLTTSRRRYDSKVRRREYRGRHPEHRERDNEARRKRMADPEYRTRINERRKLARNKNKLSLE